MKNTVLKIHKPKSTETSLKFREGFIQYLKAYKDAGINGLTDSELMMSLNTTKTDANWRRKEFVELGYVVKTEQKRKTVNGRNAIVWVITTLGLSKI